MRDFQAKIQKIEGYKSYCLRGDSHGKDCMMPYSPPGMATWTTQTFPDNDATCTCSSDFGVNCANTDPGCSADFNLPGCTAKPLASFPSSRSDITKPFEYMCQDGTWQNAESSTCGFMVYSARSNTIGKNWDCDTLKTSWARILMPVGLPLRGSDDDTDEMESKVRAWGGTVFVPNFFEIKAEIEADNDDLKVFMWGQFPWLFDYYLNRDVTFVMSAFILVFFVLWIQTESAFIATCGIFEIIVSYPLGTFVWHVLLREPYVTYLNYNALFIILGIGADDIFVLVDAFKQSALQPPHISGSLETRFAWAYHRAASAMLATSLTTCAAFAACAFSVIWDIQGFGIVASVCIACDYFLVITWLAAAVVVQERYLKYRCVWCTPANMCSKFYSACSKCCKTMKGGAPPVAANDSGSSPTNSGAKVMIAETEVEEKKPRAIEAFLGGPFADFIIKHSRKIIIFWTIMFMVSAVACGILLRQATQQVEFFDKTHFYRRSLEAASKKFNLAEGSTTNYLSTTISFGLKPNDPFDLHKSHAADALAGGDNLGDTKAYFKKEFDLADHQEDFKTACSEFHSELNSKGISGSSNYYCWIDEFSEWARNNEYGWPVSENFRDAVIAWKEAESSEEDSYEYSVASYLYGGLGDFAGLTGFLYDDERIYYTFATFNLSWSTDDIRRGDMSFTDMWNVYYDVEDAVDLAENAVGMRGGVSHSMFYDWMVASKVFFESAFMNAGIALVIAFVVILTMTLNWKLTALAFTGMLYTLAMVCLCMVIAGWEINIIEAIGISIATGMAVDYVLHLSHAYNHQPSGPAPERVRGALQEMGISILSGCFTTWIACLALCTYDALCYF